MPINYLSLILLLMGHLMHGMNLRDGTQFYKDWYGKFNYFDKPPLWKAIEKGDVNQVKQLFEYNGQILHIRWEHDFPLLYAAQNNKWDVVEYLLQQGADVNAPSGVSPTSPLYFAISQSNLDAVKLLLKHNININHQDFNEEGPLHWIASSFYTSNMPIQLAILKLSIASGAEVNAKNYLGETPLYTIISNISPVPEFMVYRKKIINVLLFHGADPYIKNSFGQFPLDLARRLEEGESRKDQIADHIEHDREKNLIPLLTSRLTQKVPQEIAHYIATLRYPEHVREEAIPEKVSERRRGVLAGMHWELGGGIHGCELD